MLLNKLPLHETVSVSVGGDVLGPVLYIGCLGPTGDSWPSSAMSRQYQPVSTLENGKAESHQPENNEADIQQRDEQLNVPEVLQIAASESSNAGIKNKNVVTFSLGADQVLFFRPRMFTHSNLILSHFCT